MSRFKKLSHTLWHCNYHIVWTPKYRYRILEDEIKVEVEQCLHQFVERQGGIIEELICTKRSCPLVSFRTS